MTNLEKYTNVFVEAFGITADQTAGLAYQFTIKVLKKPQYTIGMIIMLVREQYVHFIYVICTKKFDNLLVYIRINHQSYFIV